MDTIEANLEISFTDYHYKPVWDGTEYNLRRN
jgi:hypothetical protein